MIYVCCNLGNEKNAEAIESWRELKIIKGYLNCPIAEDVFVSAQFQIESA